MSIKHTCHWPKCRVQIPTQIYMCRQHWFTIPPRLRNELLKVYAPEQEITKTPSKAYMAILNKIQNWIKAQEANNEHSK